MKDKNIQTKRGVGKKTGFGILHARTRGRKKQRASIAGTPEDLNADIPNVGIGRVLMVILAVHVVAIGAIITHNMIRERNGIVADDTSSEVTPKTVETANKPSAAKVAPVGAVADQAPQRRANAVPQEQPRQVEPSTPKGHNTIPSFATNEPTQNPLLDNSDSAPRAVVESQVVRPNRQYNQASASTMGYKNYTVVSGDSAWRIAKNNGMTVADLLSVNGKANSSIKIGEVLKVKK